MSTSLGGWAQVLARTNARTNLEEIDKARKNGRHIYPSQGDILKAYTLVQPEQVRVVFLGQDPYHKPGEANGLCFDCSNVPYQTPSFRKISEAYDLEFPNHFNTAMMDGDMSYWAKQGCLMLNASLTVAQGAPGSHRGHWDEVITATLTHLVNTETPKVFVLLGRVAQTFEHIIVPPHGTCIREHPAAAVYADRPWKYNHLFKKVNDFFIAENLPPIDW